MRWRTVLGLPATMYPPVVQLSPGEARRLTEIGPSHLAQELRLQCFHCAVARCIDKAGIDMQTALE